VVVEGRFVGDRFRSEKILVKHDENYDEDNPDRIRDAERDAERNSKAAGGTGTGR
jgi:cytochrome c-type biogenesis protein CcmE